MPELEGTIRRKDMFFDMGDAGFLVVVTDFEAPECYRDGVYAAEVRINAETKDVSFVTEINAGKSRCGTFGAKVGWFFAVFVNNGMTRDEIIGSTITITNIGEPLDRSSVKEYFAERRKYAKDPLAKRRQN